MQIRALALKNFKGFRTFQCYFRNTTYLLGPNSAGKTTLIAALRTASSFLSHAKQRKPSKVRLHSGIHYRAYEFDSADHGFVDENIAHEMRTEVESSFRVTFSNKATLTAVWPPAGAEETSPFFYLVKGDGAQPLNPSVVRAEFPDVRVVPPLTPVAGSETVRSPERVRRQLQTRLSSQHFRNQLHMLTTDDWPNTPMTYEAMIAIMEKWTPEVKITKVTRNFHSDDVFLDAFCIEAGSARERELSWLGDGIQVWLQILFHVHLHDSVDAIILDEPDLYLHADLQRRLVRLLASQGSQTIAATHSAEVVGEAEPEHLAWVDRSQRTSRTFARDGTAAAFSRELGTGFNLGLARALRTEAVLFVEGADIKLLRQLADRLGFPHLAADTSLTVIPMDGRDNRDRVAPFKYLIDKFLDRAVKVYVVMDRDYWQDEKVNSVEDNFKLNGVRAHVWRRKELENYLLDPGLVASAASIASSEAARLLVDATDALKGDVSANIVADSLRHKVTPAASDKESIARSMADFESAWPSLAFRISRSPAKALLARVNQLLQDDGRKVLSFRQLARAANRDNVDGEMLEVLTEVESLIDHKPSTPGDT
jgi:hypothetical protein